MDRKPPRFNFMGKRTVDNNDSLTTPIIDPNAPLPSTGPHFPSFDHHTENAFGQYLQELSQSVSSDVYENAKQDKPTTFPTFPSPTITSSIPTPAIKYNHRHQQSQQSQPPTQTPPQPQVQPASSLSPSHQPHSHAVPINSHQLPNGSNNQSLNGLSAPIASSKTPSPTPPSDFKPSVNSSVSYKLSTSPSLHSNYLLPKQHGGIDYISNNSSHLSPIPVTVITTGCSSASTTFASHLSRITDVNQRLQHSTAVPSSSSSSSSIPTPVTSLNLSNHSDNNSTNTLTVLTEDVPSSSSRTNHVTLSRRHAPFSPVSTISTSSQASTVGKESVQYIVPSGSDEEQPSSRATPGRKKKMDPNRRSKLTKKEKLDRIINEEKRLQASNSALKQKIKVMERDFNLLQNIITNILIDAAKHKRSDSLRSHQEASERFKET